MIYYIILFGINTQLIEIIPSISDVELNLPKGVYLFLGYSEKDEKLLKAVTEQGAEEARGAIQGMVSFHNVNSNKVCKIEMLNNSANAA